MKVSLTILNQMVLIGANYAQSGQASQQQDVSAQASTVSNQTS